MNLSRCENGHFYDGDIYKQCPHCGAQSRNDDLTVGLTSASISDDETEMLAMADAESSLPSLVQEAVSYSSDAEDTATEGYYAGSLGVEPVVGWLVCISEGNNLGKDYRLKPERNFIGRAADMDVLIEGDNTVARDNHAIVIYEPKLNKYLMQAGDAKELSYLNEQLVLSPVELKHGDVIMLGNTKLMFIPCCNDAFNWSMLQKEPEL